MSRRISSKVIVLLYLLLSAALEGNTAVTQQYVMNRSNVPVGNRPSAVAIADVNGDGRADLIVTNFADSTVSVLLGQADGLFAKGKVFPTAEGPISVVVADFNHDGKLDLAVGTSISSVSVISILFGNGNGTFQPHVDYSVDTPPLLGLALGDYNHDGNVDIATANASSNTVSVLLGTAAGTLQPPVTYAVGESPSGIVAADLNGDGNLDLAVPNSGGSTISILLGKPDGTFKPATEVTTEAEPTAIAVADFNGDKIPDLVVMQQNSGDLSLLKGNGDGTFQSGKVLTTSISIDQIVAVDVNGDGKPDLVLRVVFDGGEMVLLGNGDGTFQSPAIYSAFADNEGQDQLALAVQDLNGDGKPDIAVTDFGDPGHVAVLLGNGDGSFNPVKKLPALQSVASVIGDFNGDGVPDFAVADFQAGEILVQLGKGKGVFQSPVVTSVPNISYLIAADFNGDGRLDVAVVGNNVAVLPGTGGGGFGAPLPVSNPPSGIRGLLAADFNNDGHQDLVVLGNGFVQQNPIYLYLGKGDGTFQPAKQFWSSSAIPITLASADFNRDGKEDLVITLNPNGIAVMLGNGDGTFGAPVIYATDELPNGLTVADVNGDGIPDVIATGDVVDVFLGNGDGTFAKRVDYPGGQFPGNLIAGDFNGDGKIDIAVAAEGGAALGDIEILLGTGTGKFATPVEVGPVNEFYPMASGDLNQDGTTDLIVSGGTGFLFLSSPIATLSPTVVNFGTVKVGHTSPAKTVTIANNGTGPLEFTKVSVSSGYDIVDNCGSALAARASCTLKVSFSPTVSGGDPGVLSLIDNAAGGQQNVILAGTGK